MFSSMVPLLVSAASFLIVGMVWYGPLYGRQWRHLSGITIDSIKMHGLPMWKAMLGGILTAFVQSFMLLQVMNLAGAQTVFAAWYIAFMVWLGFYATQCAAPFLWEGKSHKLYIIHASMYLVSLLVSATILVTLT